MEIIGNYIPSDIGSLLLTGAAGLVAVWFAFFIIRKLLGVALITLIVIGGVMVWHDPTVLRSAQDFAVATYDQWRFGSTADEFPGR